MQKKANNIKNLLMLSAKYYVTIGGVRDKNMIKHLKCKGYDVQVYYLDVDFEKSKERVKSRAEVEGRFIPEKAQHDMYYASRKNFRKIASLSDTAVLLDNRGTFPPKTAARYNKGKLQEGKEYLKARKF